MTPIAMLLHPVCEDTEQSYDYDVIVVLLTPEFSQQLATARKYLDSAPSYVEDVSLNNTIFTARYFGSKDWEEAAPDLYAKVVDEQEYWNFPPGLYPQGQEFVFDRVVLRRVLGDIEVSFRGYQDDYTCEQLTSGISLDQFLALAASPTLQPAL